MDSRATSRKAWDLDVGPYWALTEVLKWDPYPLGLPAILTVSHLAASTSTLGVKQSLCLTHGRVTAKGTR